MKDVERQLRDLEKLKPDWDSHGGEPPTEDVLCAVGNFLERTKLVPCSGGGIQIEWHQDGWDVEIEFGPDGAIEDVDASRFSVKP